MMCVAALKYAGCSLSDGFIKAKHFGISIFFSSSYLLLSSCSGKKTGAWKKILTQRNLALIERRMSLSDKEQPVRTFQK